MSNNYLAQLSKFDNPFLSLTHQKENLNHHPWNKQSENENWFFHFAPLAKKGPKYKKSNLSEKWIQVNQVCNGYQLNLVKFRILKPIYPSQPSERKF